MDNSIDELLNEIVDNHDGASQHKLHANQALISSRAYVMLTVDEEGKTHFVADIHGISMDELRAIDSLMHNMMAKLLVSRATS